MILINYDSHTLECKVWLRRALKNIFSPCFFQIWNIAPDKNLARMGLRVQTLVWGGTPVTAKRATLDKTATKVSSLVSSYKTCANIGSKFGVAIVLEKYIYRKNRRVGT